MTLQNRVENSSVGNADDTLCMDKERNTDLRPPLPPCHSYHPSHDRNHFQYKIVRSVLCRMYAASYVMDLGTEARFSAIVIFHRYCAAYFRCQQTRSAEEAAWLCSSKVKSNDHNSNDSVVINDHLGIVSAACLFLGCKVEEEARRIRDVINLSHMLDFRGRNGDCFAGLANTDCPTQLDKVVISESETPPGLDSFYWEAKEQIVATEQAVLRMLKFDSAVSHPHRAVLLILDALQSASGFPFRQSIITGAWKILNGALFNPEALGHAVMHLACAAILLSAESSPDVTLPNKWWHALGLKEEDVLKAFSSLQESSDAFSRLVANRQL
mmetsp:Transcript_16145/g.46577  ORF Transcript_16145/g.46577 Transcript_16145/m.46577 type:complete len:327 (-) Transcript_16145:367-1347(-)|eukprot:CAMPEP_0113527250 /NCGR_PEP_ID=MMETSP0015_2-20120614/1192_1 /TAXON_ID=2838 /ORGANISM="Odontella" /LENGTH=326 /DNA_ID=CAMNT_0000425665 /DNA_START=154 /DNA_END=1134 /DNA_ORIENTATION=- /assembly_acc=CAM_ASM_000160